MATSKPILLVLCVIALGVWTLVLQTAGVIAPLKPRTTAVNVTNPDLYVIGTVDVDDVRGTVEIQCSDALRVETDGALDVNLHSVVGQPLVTTELGMSIGVASTMNTVVPINWGEVSISK